MKASWNNETLADSDETIIIEGNYYFPADSIRREYFQESTTHTTCPWKGEASYYNIIVQGDVNPDAAWYFPAPNKAAEEIKNYVAFRKGVKILP